MQQGNWLSDHGLSINIVAYDSHFLSMVWAKVHPLYVLNATWLRKIIKKPIFPPKNWSHSQTPPVYTNDARYWCPYFSRLRHDLSQLSSRHTDPGPHRLLTHQGPDSLNRGVQELMGGHILHVYHQTEEAWRTQMLCNVIPHHAPSRLYRPSHWTHLQLVVYDRKFYGSPKDTKNRPRRKITFRF